MTTSPLFSGFDGLMNLSRREGVDIRPTLLRVLADLYVQTNTHSEQEARQFVELTSRLIDQVDDATRAAVRARLALYPATPAPVLKHLGLKPLMCPTAACRWRVKSGRSRDRRCFGAGQNTRSEAQLRMASKLSMQPKDAAEISGLFFGASSPERALILHNLSETPLKASPRVPALRARTLDRSPRNGRLGRRRRKLHARARRNPDIALENRDPGRQRSDRRTACLRGQSARHAEPGLSAGFACSSSPRSAPPFTPSIGFRVFMTC